ncbi:MAG: FtsQ-type POTRA domain-containing protein [Desulfovibrionaceae bacterium]|nr:FtsQ-type POTRA domain-containing protein [Desulfovibrionaceae bacterium]
MGLNFFARPAPDAPKAIAGRDFYPSRRLRQSLHDADLRKKERSPARRIWRKAKTALRWSAGLALGLVCMLGITLALVTTHRQLTSPGYFALQEILVEGSHYLDKEEIPSMLGLVPGQNILALSIRRMEQILERNPWVREWSIRRDAAKGSLHIRIREAEPLYWVRDKEGRLYYSDEHGRSIAPVEATHYSILPLLEVEPGAGDLPARLPGLVDAFSGLNFPLNISGVKLIRLTEARTMELTTRENRRLIIGLENWESNLMRLLRVMEDLARNGELKRMLEIRVYGKDIWVRLGDDPQQLTGTWNGRGNMA